MPEKKPNKKGWDPKYEKWYDPRFAHWERPYPYLDSHELFYRYRDLLDEGMPRCHGIEPILDEYGTFLPPTVTAFSTARGQFSEEVANAILDDHEKHWRAGEKIDPEGFKKFWPKEK